MVPCGAPVALVWPPHFAPIAAAHAALVCQPTAVEVAAIDSAAMLTRPLAFLMVASVFLLVQILLCSWYETLDELLPTGWVIQQHRGRFLDDFDRHQVQMRYLQKLPAVDHGEGLQVFLRHRGPCGMGCTGGKSQECFSKTQEHVCPLAEPISVSWSLPYP